VTALIVPPPLSATYAMPLRTTTSSVDAKCAAGVTVPVTGSTRSRPGAFSTETSSVPSHQLFAAHLHHHEHDVIHTSYHGRRPEVLGPAPWEPSTAARGAA